MLLSDLGILITATIDAVRLKCRHSYTKLINISKMRRILSRNPFTAEVRQEFNYLSNAELDQKLDRAEKAYEVHSKRTILERAALIKRLGESIEKRFKDASECITWEMGKPITDSRGEVSKAIRFCKYYSENYAPILPQLVQSEAKKQTMVKYLPLGTIYYLIPFNYPFYLNFKGGLPNLLLGNVLLARNADSCPNVGRIVEECMIDAGLGNGEYQNVYTNYEQLDQIFERNSVCGVSFTGSSRGGALIAEKAGKHLKRSVMELGGNDPFIVLDDGDVNKAVTFALAGRCANAGQVCFSPKRFIIHKNHYEAFRKGLIEGLSKIPFGDPMLETTRMGPLARQDLADNLNQQLKSLPKSYKITWQRTEMKAPFFPITVIEGSDEPWDEELFGPVFQLFRIEDDAHAIRLANSGSYGLGGSVFSAARGEQVIDQVRCGLGFVNDIPKSEPPFPSGGVVRSGFGRECGSEGYKQFANIKTHWVS